MAELAPTRTGVLGDSDYRRRLGEAVGALEDRTGETATAALDTIDRLWSGNRMRFGRWHGDWTPWNTSSGEGSVILWDWERTAPDVPIGFDVLHYHFQPRFLGRPTRDQRAPLRRALRSGSAALEHLAVPSAEWEGLAALYLLELQVRFAAAAEIGGPGAGELADRVGSTLRLHLAHAG